MNQCVCVFVVFMCVKCGYETDLQLILFEWNAEEEKCLRILFSIQIASLITTLVFLSLYISVSYYIYGSVLSDIIHVEENYYYE